MRVSVVKDPEEWNSIVDKSPFSALHHRYELFSYYEHPLPLIAENQDHKFLFPLRITELFKGFRLAISPIYSYASVLPNDESNLSLMPKALDCIAAFLKKMKISHLSLCAPTFLSKQYTTLLNDWFREHKASRQILYAHMIRCENATFGQILKTKFTKGARYNVRKAEKEGISVIEINTEDDIRRWMEDIYNCNLSALKRQGREGAYPDSNKQVYFSELISDKKRLREHFCIYGAIYHERLIAYLIVQKYKKLMLITKIMSHTDFLDKRPNDALFAFTIKKACEADARFLEYGLERTKLGGKIPSLYPMLEEFFEKFGFEEIPVYIYRLGLTHSGRMLQYLFSGKEYLMTRYAYLPESMRNLLIKLYAPRRRSKLFNFLNA